MRRALVILLVILFVPAFLVTFTVIHELGHTLLARLLGDPASVFYLARFEAHSTCLGCNIYDPAKLTWAGNLVVSLGGLIATQGVALIALVLRRQPLGRPLYRRLLGAVAFGFAFLDVPVQVLQGLLYDLSRETWPTNVDLVDCMLLVQAKTGACQVLMKGLLFVLAVLYLSGFIWFSRRARAGPKGRAEAKAG